MTLARSSHSCLFCWHEAGELVAMLGIEVYDWLDVRRNAEPDRLVASKPFLSLREQFLLTLSSLVVPDV
jgi:hypothetical protein